MYEHRGKKLEVIPPQARHEECHHRGIEILRCLVYDLRPADIKFWCRI